MEDPYLDSAGNEGGSVALNDCTEQNTSSIHNYADDPSLSPNQKETFSTIARDLDLLCQATQDEKSLKLYTGPYGRIISPFKRFSSFHAFPSSVKRSPRKLTGPAPKRTKLFHEDDEGDTTSNSDESPQAVDKVQQVLYKMEEVEASGDDSSEEDKWEIVEEEVNNDIDNNLEDKSSKFSLSAMNVKSIIHKIITNENVVEMVRKAVQEEIEEQEMKFEPKLTRSKLKEFEAKGHLPTNWGLSPRKKRESPNFLDMELPEDEEDDEDFNPDKLIQESDEDSESVHSSCISDLGSPLPSTPKSKPLTPTVSQPSTSQTRTTPSTTDNENSSQSFLSPMGPPLQTNVPKSNRTPSSLGQKYKDAMEKDSLTQDQEEEELIARRTRSKYSLNDCSIFDIEANFVAPDITPDLYDTSCDDNDWREFLAGCIIPAEDIKNNHVDVDDPENDPEYNYIEDANAIEVDKEDFRDDRAVKVSKKEVNELLDDILNSELETSVIDEQYKITIKTQSEKIVFDSNKKKQKVYQQSLISEIGEYERRQIDDQLRKHVQQLTQTYVMTQNGIEEHSMYGETAKSLLYELDSFGKKAIDQCGESAFDACNLRPALVLVNDDSWTKSPEPTDSEREKIETIAFKYDFQSLPAFSYQQMQIMWNSKIFMFPELLPHGGFFEVADIKKDRLRVRFLESEDNLLAMGVAQFQHLKKEAKDYIQRFMLPCKSRKQIEIRIKNLKASAAKDNPVKFFSIYKVLPKFPQHAPLFDLSSVRAPKDCGCDWHELPVWCKFFCPEADSSLNESVRDQQQRRLAAKKRRKAKQTASFTEPEVKTVHTSPFLPAGSAPVTPKSLADSSLLDSSDSSPELSPVKRKRQRKRSRKNLNFNKVIDAGNSLLSSFVPLTLSDGKSFPLQNNSVTVCVLNNSQVGPEATPFPGSTTYPVVGATPSVIVIDNNIPMETTGMLPSSGQPVDDTTQNLITQSVDFESDTGEIDCQNLTFADICRPIMESVLGTEMSESCDFDGSKENCTLPQNLDSETFGNSASADAVMISAHDLQSNEITSTVTKEPQNESVVPGQSMPALYQDIATSPIRITNMLLPVSSVTNTANVNQSALTSGDSQCIKGLSPLFETTPTQDLSDNGINRESNISMQCQHSGEKTPKNKYVCSDASSSEKSPKSSVDVVASLASYFLSPIQNSGTLSQQQRLETTPTKNRFQAIAPKPSPVNQHPSTLSFHRSPRKYIKSKVKFSPRKRQLQQQAQTILPKGFVVSTYDTSPAKKAASVLVDRAKQVANQSPGLRKILPRPPNSHKDVLKLTKQLTKKRSGTPVKSVSVNGVTSDDALTSDTYSQIEGDVREPVNSASVVEDDDRCGDTESDYTQSEDGNETQGTDCDDIDTQGTDDGDVTHGTDGDSQDSQEEDDIPSTDNLIKSTTVSYAPSKDYLYSRARHVKKGKNRDMTLALLESDLVESDPQRDLRDTLFAQAYIHKVKKVLKDDMDKLEAFLKIMCNFSKEGESPIKLYGDLKDLFSDHPDLMNDFAGFLQREQAIECGCYKPYQEFHQARTFLRKLEVYFSKNPNQLQKVMRTFSRWYKKPGRHDADLREQIEPMLKGQKFLLEEFASFFPDDRPCESLMDDFEEVILDDSGDNCAEDKESSFEEIELLDLEEVVGTKRCTCACHDSGDDTYRKKKKHCYNCGLTVIDGELVYKVNKTTIKKINVEFGPSVKISSLKGSEQSDEISGPVQDLGQEPVMSCNEIQIRSSQESSNVDWFRDSVTAEKENIEHFSEEIQNERNNPDRKISKEKSSPVKEAFLQRISKVPHNKSVDKQARLASVLQQMSPPPVEIVDKQQEIAKETLETSETSVVKEILCRVEDQVEAMEIDSVNVGLTPSSQVLVSLSQKKSEEVNTDREEVRNEERLTDKEISSSAETITGESRKIDGIETDFKNKECAQNNVSEQSDLTEKALKTVQSVEKATNDILATAFTNALNAEVSMDSICFPFNTKDPSLKSMANLNSDPTHELADKSVLNNSSVSSAVVKQTSPPFSSEKSSIQSAPIGLSTLHVSTDSSFSKVTALPFSSNLGSEHDERMEGKEKVDNQKKRVEAVVPLSLKSDMVSDGSRSPPFSPFSPFAQEIQSITSALSPLSAVNSPGICRSLSTSSKVRRITPIPVKEADASVESPLAFQTVVKNSPVLPEINSVNSPVDKLVHSNDNIVSSVSSTIVTASPKIPADNQALCGNHVSAYPGTDSSSSSQKGENLSQKSSSSNSNSNNVDLSSSQTSIVAFSSITISRPDLHSDNANVGFPKSTSKTGMEPGGILSEESLFQCLSKPPQFTDTLHTVSGLTNILNALEDHSKHSGLGTNTKNEIKTASNVQICEHSDDSVRNKCNPEKSNTPYLGNHKDTDHNRERTEISHDEMQLKVDNVKNIIENNDDVDLSHRHAVMLPSAKDIMMPKVSDLSSSNEGSGDGICEVKDVNKNVGKNENRRKSKMSRRELRRSLQGKDLNKQIDGIVENGATTSSVRIMKDESSELSVGVCSSDVNYEHKKTTDNDSISNNCIIDNSCVIANVNPETGLSGVVLNELDNVEVKTEADTGDFEYSGTSDVQSISDAVSDTYSKGRKKSKHKKNRPGKDDNKKKKRKKGESTDDPKQYKQKKKRKQQLEVVQTITSAEQPVTDHEEECIVSPVNMIPSLEVSQSSVNADERAQNISPSSLYSDNMELEPEWSKETDKTILETCKVHGIKDKTFTRIAKHIGNVTAKQVRRRFSTLYLMIFGVTLDETKE